MLLNNQNYRKASPIELVHKMKKDEEISQFFQQKINYLTENEGVIKMSTPLYLILCYFVTQKSLGEEYCYLSSFNPQDKIFMKKRLKIYAMVKILMIFFGQKFIDFIVQKLPKFSNQRLWNNIVNDIKENNNIYNHFNSLHDSFFFFFSNFYEFSNRMTNVQYLNIFPSSKKQITFKKVALIIWITKIIQLVFFIRKMMKYSQQPIVIPEKESSQATQDCKICLEKINGKSVTKCGHLFCWNCIIKYTQIKEECPLCRKQCLSREIVFLTNF